MISVIVSIFNVEDYLPRCLDCVVGQTYTDLEIILVDDGSTDGSSRICDEYAKADNRIRVVHQGNQGRSSARNTGLRAALGDYILMVDGDDVLHPRMIEILYKLIVSGDYDFSMCYGEKVWDVSTIPAKSTIEIDTDASVEIDRDTCMKNLFLSWNEISMQYAVVWNKLFKRSLLNNTYFVNTEEEDVEYNNRVYLKITKAAILPYDLYYYIQRPSSIIYTGGSHRLVTSVDSVSLCLNNIPVDNKLYRAYCLRRLYRRMLSAHYWARHSSVSQETEANLKNLRRETIAEFMQNPYIPFFEKRVLVLFVYCPVLYDVFMSLMELRAMISTFFRKE